MKKHDFSDNWEFRKAEEDTWQEVTLPHDAMLSEGRSPAAPGGSGIGFFHGGRYEYRKKFTAQDDWRNKHIELEFGGVYGSYNKRRTGGAFRERIPSLFDQLG